MTEQELTNARNTLRVSMNLQVLLNEGLFEGKHSVALAESHQLVKSLIEDLQKSLKPVIVPATPSDVASLDLAK